jgi:hypothetical protein
MEAPVMRSVFDSVDLEIIDQVYEAAWAHLQASQPDRDTGSDGNRQDALRKKIFGVARVVGSGHVDFDTLSEVVLATIPSGRRAWGTARSEGPSGITG